MRFASLSLACYGHFENTLLSFRAGAPDLHVIYGANEAGKTTALAAVSDLLFGFPTRSPYNFLFDYSLLRVGAVLEDNGTALECRRKKGNSATLLDARDAVIDEAPLLAMLKGQTRETFGLSFSLNQDALRSGGRAMVEARNDLGRTLFAAGSGLTGIADELRRLEAEADAIWGPKAAARRSFTKAQSDLAESLKIVRAAALKPKTWSDAKVAEARTAEALAALRTERDGVQAALGGAQRVRRLAPLARRREELLAQLAAHDGVIDLGPAREDSATAILGEADTTQRAKAVAEQLLGEVRARKAEVAADPGVLAEAGEIDELVSGAGAGEKAARDVIRLEADYAAAERAIQDLRAEAGANADASPRRDQASRLRDLAHKHAEISAARNEIEVNREELAERRRRADARCAAAGAPEAADALMDAVEAARALGADVDARCEATGRTADAAGAAVPLALRRLAPWTGAMGDLRALPRVADAEIERARAELADLEAEIRRETEKVQRARDAAAEAALEIEGIGAASAVSPEEVAAAQRERAALWSPIRTHALGGPPLPSPDAAVAAFEASLERVDETLERRFALARESSRLSLLERAKGVEQLHAKQAAARLAEAEHRRAALLEAWGRRCAAVGLPDLEPLRLQVWQDDRATAEVAQEEHDLLAGEADAMAARRDGMRAALAAALGRADPSGPLGPMLALAERRRQDIDAADQERRLAQAELDQVENESAGLVKRAQWIAAKAADNAAAWSAALAEAGLDFDPDTCDAVLDGIEALRVARASQAELRRRIDGISRDAKDHAARVHALADRLGLPAGDDAPRLRALRDRLADARAAASVFKALEQEEARRSGEAGEADAQLRAAEAALAPLMAETAAQDRGALATAIARSRARRALAEALAETERSIVDGGDGLGLQDLLAAVIDADPDALAGVVSSLDAKLNALNAEVDRAAAANAVAMSTFADLDAGSISAAAAAADVALARSELEVLAEDYILKRAQAVTLRWAIEQYRERHQDPLLLRAGELFSTLTLGRYATLRVDNEGTAPRLLGLRDDGRTVVEVGHMSEGTTDQLFLALRLAALEQSVRSGVSLPFLADDLFVNFDDARAEAGFRVLAEVAASTQVLFFTHHPHLVGIARSVVGADRHSSCVLA